MSKIITLVKASVVRGHGGAVRPSGFTAEVDDGTYQTLLSRGVIEPEPEPVPPADTEDAEAPEPAAEVEEDPEPEPEPEPEPVPPADGKSGGKLPPMTAPIAVWREAADKIGIKTAGMKKPEIIGAIKHHLGE